MIRTYAEAEQALRPFVERNSGTYTTHMTQRLSGHVGSPEAQLRVVHVAGTSGKTSTCYYVRALLEAAGQKTGLTVSPHIISLADRVQVGGEPLGEAEFCRYLEEFLGLIEDFDGQPSYFEVMMVFALWVFAREAVDYAVIETGLGGLHDSSNICRRADKLCVLTDIGYDHMNVLGDSLAEIAAQKVGIVHPGNHLLSYRQSPEVMEAVRQVENVMFVEPPATADYRERNFGLARAAYKWLRQRNGLSELSTDQIAACQAVRVPGRLDIFRRDGVTVVLDGAHNQQKTEALVRTFRGQFPEVQPVVVLAMKQGKEYKEVIRLLKPLARHVITTEFVTLQDTPMGAISADILAAECERHGIPTETERDILQAVARAQNIADFVLVTGSLYAVSEVRRAL